MLTESDGENGCKARQPVGFLELISASERARCTGALDDSQCNVGGRRASQVGGRDAVLHRLGDIAVAHTIILDRLTAPRDSSKHLHRLPYLV